MAEISADALAQLFTNARTHNAWQSKEVSDQTLRKLYDYTRWAPTSANINPIRLIFVKSKEAKAKLLTAVSEGNVQKTKEAPVTAIIAQDMEFYEHLPRLFPQVDARSWFAGNTQLIEDSATKNTSLQAGYFILAARALGLDCGPMAGFDGNKVKELFFADKPWKANLLVNLGYGEVSKLFPRNPRFEFDEVAKIL